MSSLVNASSSLECLISETPEGLVDALSSMDGDIEIVTIVQVGMRQCAYFIRPKQKIRKSKNGTGKRNEC